MLWIRHSRYILRLYGPVSLNEMLNVYFSIDTNWFKEMIWTKESVANKCFIYFLANGSFQLVIHSVSSNKYICVAETRVVSVKKNYLSYVCKIRRINLHKMILCSNNMGGGIPEISAPSKNHISCKICGMMKEKLKSFEFVYKRHI